MIDKELIASIESNLLAKLQSEGGDLVSALSLGSPRAIGDAVQAFIEEHLQECIPEKFIGKYEDDFSRRSMEDVAFSDNNGNYYAVDVKTHNKGTEFNMPNLISAKRLSTFYRNDTNHFCILMVVYEIVDSKIKYTECHFKPIEYFEWACLTLGALGWGQIQIKNSNDLLFVAQPSRKQWMLKLCKAMDQFYGTEIQKINERKSWFEKEKEFWEKHG